MSEPHKRPNRHPKYRKAYRVINWPDYEKSLRDRGDVTVWFSDDAIKFWQILADWREAGRLEGLEFGS